MSKAVMKGTALREPGVDLRIVHGDVEIDVAPVVFHSPAERAAQPGGTHPLVLPEDRLQPGEDPVTLVSQCLMARGHVPSGRGASGSAESGRAIVIDAPSRQSSPSTSTFSQFSANVSFARR